jgi:hypothetical protein
VREVSRTIFDPEPIAREVLRTPRPQNGPVSPLKSSKPRARSPDPRS